MVARKHIAKLERNSVSFLRVTLAILRVSISNKVAYHSTSNIFTVFPLINWLTFLIMGIIPTKKVFLKKKTLMIEKTMNQIIIDMDHNKPDRKYVNKRMHKKHTDLRIDVISFFHLIFFFIGSISASVGAVLSPWITSPLPLLGSSSLVFSVEPSSPTSRFRFFFVCEVPFCASKFLASSWSCSFSAPTCPFSVTLPLGVSSNVGSISGTVTSVWLDCFFTAWNPRAFALCFFPSAWSSKVCLLVAFVLQRLRKTHET